MFRVLTKLMSFRRATSLIPQSTICLESNQPAAPALPLSDFIKQCKPLSIPELRQRSRTKETTGKWTLREYLRGDTLGAAVLDAEEINQHRSRVMDYLSRDKQRRRGHTHVLIVAGANIMSGYPFRQTSEFLYLCDCLLPGAVIVLLRNRQMELRTVLCHPRQEQEMDPMLAKIACKRFNVDQIMTLPQLKQLLCRRCNHASAKLWFSLDKGVLSKYLRELADELHLPINCPRQLMQYAQSFKTANEITAISRAHSIAAQSLEEVMSEHTPRKAVQHMPPLFAYKCSERSAHQPLPYEPMFMVGSGGMLLMDAACQYAGYCGSLARSWPSLGRFTPPQKVIYNMLLELRFKLFTLIAKSGSIICTPRDLSDLYLTMLADQLKELRVLPSNLRKPIDIYKAVGKFSCFPRLIKHVGLDLAESSEELLSCPISPGNVFSFRLSICIPHDCHQTYPEFRGIFCVLGDSIHITEDHTVELLTGECSSTGRNVEQLRMRNLRTERASN